METLEKIIGDYVEKHVSGTEYDNIQPGNPDFSTDNIKQAITEGIKNRVIEEVIEQRKKELLKMAKEEIEKEKRKSSLVAIKELMWEAFVLAIFVGLLVNEITTLIEYLKGFGGEEGHTVITIALILIFSVIVLLLYVVKFTKDIIDKFVNKKR